MSKTGSKWVLDYFMRSFRAVDGLWFMKVEEKYGFDTALKLDTEVWKVMSKIQARMIKSTMNPKKNSDTLFESLTTKLDVEGFKFKAEKIENGFRIVISDCPWHNIMIKSGREKLAGVVGESICSSEYQAWSSEIDENVRFELKSLKCKKSPNCILEFIHK